MRLPRSGTEPTTARSAYGLRRVLAVVALLGCGVGAIVFALVATRASGTGLGAVVVAGLLFIVALTALADLIVLHRGRGDDRPTTTSSTGRRQV